MNLKIEQKFIHLNSTDELVKSLPPVINEAFRQLLL